MKPNPHDLIAAARSQALLLDSTCENLLATLEAPTTSQVERDSILELLVREAWEELNDRFYKHLAFGTGGIRGRTIGKVVTRTEQAGFSGSGSPLNPAVGTNMMNTGNVRRAAQGLGEYLLKTFGDRTLKVVIAHDTRHFSHAFTNTCAEALASQGIDVFLFPEERSTPQLSFAVRHLRAHGGIVITASHNPPHDNGFKAYFNDGGQLVEPHAKNVVAEVQALASGAPVTRAEKPGTITMLTEADDAAYVDAVASIVLEPEIFKQADLRVVYTPIHGTGIRIIPRLFDRFAVSYSVVAAQREPNGQFPTVKSPNPEESAALALAIEQARSEGADLVIGTDPDCDRMGAAVRNNQGEFEVITGNMIGSILAYYRTERFFAQGRLTPETALQGVLIKTFVTTDLQKAIARHFGVRCVDTLTGFKYIGEKLRIYQATGEKFIFGGEESYGYAGGTYARDKDGNAAALMLAEVAAWAKSQGKTLLEYLDEIYCLLGFYCERLGSLTFEGASGAAQIQKLLASYRSQSPAQFMSQAVTKVEDFGMQTFHDIDGKEIPKETMLIFHLADGSRMAVRGSGTEPKIKFYFFTQAPATAETLGSIKQQRRAFLDAWWQEVQADVSSRIA